MRISRPVPSFRAWLAARALCWLALTAANALSAQDRELTLLQFENGSAKGLKALVSVDGRATPCEVIGVDPGSVVRCACPTGTAPDRVGLDPEERAVRPLGTTQLHADGTATFTGLAPFPVHQDTGDPIADDARYTAWKTAWIAAFPDRYAALLLDPLETKVP